MLLKSCACLEKVIFKCKVTASKPNLIVFCSELKRFADSLCKRNKKAVKTDQILNKIIDSSVNRDTMFRWGLLSPTWVRTKSKQIVIFTIIIYVFHYLVFILLYLIVIVFLFSFILCYWFIYFMFNLLILSIPRNRLLVLTHCSDPTINVP